MSSVCSSANSLCSINAVVIKGHAPLLMSSNICYVGSQGISNSSSCSFRLCSPGHSQIIINHAAGSSSISTTYSSCPTIMGQTIRLGYSLGSCCTNQQKGTNNNVQLSSSIVPQGTHHKVSLLAGQSMMNVRLSVTKPKILQRVRSTVGAMNWPRGCASAGFVFGLLVCNSSKSGAINVEPVSEYGNDRDECNDDESCVKFSHGKKVYTDYYVIGIPGDGRCLFRSVAHGVCLRSGKPPSSERLQRELADELRAQVADEFIKRRKETEWFVEGDFETYVSQIRKPHVWGGEPEMFIASHVLQVPITVYMYDEDAGGLIPIAEYGQEHYGKENPVRVLYHGSGHYDALEIPRKRMGPRPRL